MDSALLYIFENQVLPTGLHDVSKRFRANSATIRVFATARKFIPIWKKAKIYKPFSELQDFRTRMTNKMFVRKLPWCFCQIGNLALKTVGGLLNNTKKLMNFVKKIVMVLQKN